MQKSFIDKLFMVNNIWEVIFIFSLEEITFFDLILVIKHMHCFDIAKIFLTFLKYHQIKILILYRGVVIWFAQLKGSYHFDL